MTRSWLGSGVQACLLAWLLCAGACTPEGGAAGGGDPAPLRAEATTHGVQAILELSPPRPTLTDAITLTLTVISDPAMAVRMPEFTDRLGDFSVRGFSEPPDEQQGERMLRRQEYRLEPAAAGFQFVPPLPVGVPAPDGGSTVLVTDPLEVEVGTLSGQDAPRLSDLAPAEDAVPMTGAATTSFWLPLAGGAWMAFVVLIWWWRRLRRAMPVAPRLSPRELAEQEFAALNAADPLGRGDVKTWYVELTAIVRRYIERTDGIRAPELTTPEFLRALQQAVEVPADRRQALGGFLEAADLVKFAAHQPTRQDIQGSEHHAKRLVGLEGADGAAGADSAAGAQEQAA